MPAILAEPPMLTVCVPWEVFRSLPLSDVHAGLQLAELLKLTNSAPVPEALAIMAAEPPTVIVPSTITTGRVVPMLLAIRTLEAPSIVRLPVIYTLPVNVTSQLLVMLTLPLTRRLAGQVRTKPIG